MCDLGVVIVPGDAKCLGYRKSGNDSCRGCDEFKAVAVKPVPDVVNIKAVEVKSMATPKVSQKRLRKGDKFNCPECGRPDAVYESGGLCGVCNTARRKAARLELGLDKLEPEQKASVPVLPTGPVFKPSAEYPDLAADAAEVSASFGKVKNADGEPAGFGVDPMVHMAMRDAWYDVERKALEALSGLSPISALARAHDFVQQIQRLEVQP